MFFLVFLFFIYGSEVKQVVNKKYEGNPGINLVKNVVDLCFKIKENDKNKKNNSIKKDDYKNKNDLFFKEMSKNYDFLKVSKESLQYDYDPASAKYKKHHWDGKTPKEKQKFVSVFEDLLSSIVYPICGNFFAKRKIVHSVVNSDKNNIEIKTKVYLKKKYVLVNWFMHKVNGVWKVYDIYVEEESWVDSFRNQFTEVIEKKSYNELIDIMKKKKKEVLDKRESKNKKKAKKVQNNKEILNKNEDKSIKTKKTIK